MFFLNLTPLAKESGGPRCHTRLGVPGNVQLSQQLSKLEQVLDFLKLMNLQNQTEVPTRAVLAARRRDG